MKKILFGLMFGLSCIGCAYPSGFYIESAYPVAVPHNPYPNTVIVNVQTGRQYGCTPFENFNACMYRVCVQSGWDMNNCRWRSTGYGYYDVYPAFSPYGYYPGYSRTYIEYHSHHPGCGHNSAEKRSPVRKPGIRRR